MTAYFRAAYLRSARTMTSVTVIPSPAAFAFTACHRSSGTRTFRYLDATFELDSPAGRVVVGPGAS